MGSLEVKTLRDPNFSSASVSVYPTVPIGGWLKTAEATYSWSGLVGLLSKRVFATAISGSTERSFMKIVVDSETDRVVGVHMCGDDAAEIMQGIAIAVKMGATKADFDATVGIHPTAA